MVVMIAKTFDFDAAHWLPMVPEDHKCRRMHGHTYRVEICLRDRIRADGFVRDYAELAAAWEPIHAQIDHRTLNEIEGLENPTTEILVGWLVTRLQATFKHSLWTVRVYESSTTWVEWMP